MEIMDCVNDNVHGRVELTALEKDLTETPTFLRLGRIQQLGLASMVFPGATHTRLSHSLGTLHIMGKIARRLKLNDEEEEMLRLAALLHDIGQYPLSHVTESVYRKIGDVPSIAKTAFENPERIEEAIDHNLLLQPVAFPLILSDSAKDKKVGEEVIRKRPDLQEVFRKHGRNDDFITNVIRVITGTHHTTLFKNLMDSDYDCDRLDYICRDAQLAGVKYGMIDLEYLIENLTAPNYPPTSTDRVLAVKKRKAMHTLEHYLTSRYYMYSQIINHKTVRSLELIARAIFSELARKGLVYPSYREIIQEIPNARFLFFDDTYFFSKIFDYYNGASDGDAVRQLIQRLVEKRPLTMVKEYRKLFNREEDSCDAEYDKVKSHLFHEGNLTNLCKTAGISKDCVIVEENTVEFVPIGPNISYKTLIAGPEEHAQSFMASPRLYHEDTNTTEFLLGDRSSILYALAKFELKIARVFLNISDEGDIRRFSSALRETLR